jgi:hypothetical protein
MRPSNQALIAVTLACGIALLSGSPAQAGEAKMRSITTWDAGCTASTRGSWDNMADAWYDELTYFWIIPGWAWTRSGRQVNGSIVDSDYTDCGNLTWGDDCNVTDNADALLATMHGYDNGSDHRWYGKVRVNESGDGNCNAYQGHIELGDVDLEFLVLSSCLSMDYEDWWPEWSSSFNGLHQIDGFHGLMWIYDWLPDYYGDFAFDAFFMGMGDAFLDNLYIPNISDNYDQCPVARNVGTNSDDSLNRMNLERYSVVFSDPPGIGTSRNHRARYIVQCDPKAKEALP